MIHRAPPAPPGMPFGTLLADDAITTRDYFAAMAMQGLITACYSNDNDVLTEERICEKAYQYADRMIASRPKI